MSGNSIRCDGPKSDEMMQKRRLARRFAHELFGFLPEQIERFRFGRDLRCVGLAARSADIHAIGSPKRVLAGAFERRPIQSRHVGRGVEKQGLTLLGANWQTKGAAPRAATHNRQFHLNCSHARFYKNALRTRFKALNARLNHVHAKEGGTAHARRMNAAFVLMETRRFEMRKRNGNRLALLFCIEFGGLAGGKRDAKQAFPKPDALAGMVFQALRECGPHLQTFERVGFQGCSA